MTRPMRIAQVATSAMAVRLLLASQIKALQRAGHEVTIVCGHDGWEQEAATLAPVRPIPFSRRVAPGADLRALRALLRTFRRERFDLVNTHTPKAGLLGPMAARLARTPAVAHTVHGFLFHDQMPAHQRAFFRSAERFTATWSHDLLFQSREDLETARRLRFRPADRLHYVGNGIDLRHFDAGQARSRKEVRAELGYDEDEFVVGTVARLVYEKGFQELFDAAQALAPKHPRLRFMIVGPDEPDQDDRILPAEKAAVEARGNVRFLGLRRDVRDLYQGMDLFVLPSYREGIPRALLEAAACGIPAVATDIRGCREVLPPGTGRLVPVRDAAALASAIDDVAARPAEAAERARRAQRHVRAEFDERVMNRRIVEALEAIGARQLRRGR